MSPIEELMQEWLGYIDSDKDKVHKMVKDRLSPGIGRPVGQLEDLLLFGSVKERIYIGGQYTCNR